MLSTGSGAVNALASGAGDSASAQAPTAGPTATAISSWPAPHRPCAVASSRTPPSGTVTCAKVTPPVASAGAWTTAVGSPAPSRTTSSTSSPA